MQYQICRKDNKEIVAWIETDSSVASILIHDDYVIKSGEELLVKSEKGKVYAKDCPESIEHSSNI